MQVTAIAPWAGCKRSLAERIVSTFPKHDFYAEPFAGGAAVYLAKEPCAIEILNDLHEDLTNLMRVVSDQCLAPLLYRRLRRVMFCQGIHDDACNQLAETQDPFERAYLYFIKAWMSWGGVAGTKRAGRKMSIRWSCGGGNQAKRFSSAVESIPAWRRRMRNTTILNMDAFKLLDSIQDSERAVIYADPPYAENHVDYEHEFPSLDKERAARLQGDTSIKGHIALSESLHRFKRAHVVLSYYDHPMLAELYPDWSIQKIEVTKAIAQICKRESHRQRAVEVLLTNQPTGGLFDERGA